MRLANKIALCLTLAAAALSVTAQQQPQQPKSPVTITPSANSTTPHNWTTEQILTCTVSDCWQLAGKERSNLLRYRPAAREISAQTRGLTLPDNATAGQRAGEYIKAKAKADHGQLLYAIVDASIRKIGTPATATK